MDTKKEDEREHCRRAGAYEKGLRARLLRP